MPQHSTDPPQHRTRDSTSGVFRTVFYVHISCNEKHGGREKTAGGKLVRGKGRKRKRCGTKRIGQEKGARIGPINVRGERGNEGEIQEVMKGKTGERRHKPSGHWTYNVRTLYVQYVQCTYTVRTVRTMYL